MKGILKKLSRLSGINKITNKVIPPYRLCRMRIKPISAMIVNVVFAY